MDPTINKNEPELKRHYKGHKDTITSISFNSKTNQIATSSLDTTMMIWNFNQGSRCTQYMGHTDAVNCATWSPNGDIVATASNDKTVRLWVPKINGGSGELKAHTMPVRWVDFDAEGQMLVTGSNDKSIKIWQISHKVFIKSLTAHTNWINCVKFSPNNKLIGSCSDDRTIKFHDFSTYKCVNSFSEDKSIPITFAWHPDNNLFAVSLVDNNTNANRVKIYDLKSNNLLQLYQTHSNVINSLDFHPSGNYLLTGSDDGTMKILDLLEGRPLYTLSGHQDRVTAVNFSKDGEYFASGGSDKYLMVWNTNLTESNSTYSTVNHKNVVDSLCDDSFLINPRGSKNYHLNENDYENIPITYNNASVIINNNNSDGDEKNYLINDDVTNTRDILNDILDKLDILFLQINSLSCVLESHDKRLLKLEENL